MEPRRCGVHGLVVGDDGRCVICRRGEAEAAAPKTSSEWPIVVTLAVVAVLIVGTGGFWITRKIQEVSRAPAIPTEVTLPPEPEPTVVEPKATPNPFAGEPKPWDTVNTPVASAPPTADDLTPDQLEALKRKVKVTMYMTKKCGLCTSARTFMKSGNYPLIERDIEASETDKIELASINPEATVPTFDVEGVVLVGYDVNALDRAIENAALKKKPKK